MPQKHGPSPLLTAAVPLVPERPAWGLTTLRSQEAWAEPSVGQVCFLALIYLQICPPNSNAVAGDANCCCQEQHPRQTWRPCLMASLGPRDNLQHAAAAASSRRSSGLALG